jgi:FkbM family methyltransferase
MSLGRPPARLLAAPFRRRHYRAVAGIFRTFEEPGEAFRRYVLDKGPYPWTPTLRTPLGPQEVTLYSSHDVRTVTEVFCRRDYGDGGGEVVVDLGANIGISALFFLTRRPDARVYCHEPDPRNAARLRSNLERFVNRYRLAEVAVSVSSGRAAFVQEQTGRYSGLAEISTRTGREIEVECREMAKVLGDVLAIEDRIDLLKIDTEGNESELFAAIPADQLGLIREVYYETNEADGQTAHFKS